jgi:XRE family transcriptional regulator, aerobic/anaerobic benzoate catabolism transcriptional regulator
MRRETLLATVGARVRSLRERQGYSRRHLSERSGISERFLAQLEGGQGNISLARFADVAEALGTTPAELLAGAPGIITGGRCVVALLGVRGAGKSTAGAQLAARCGVPFVELDQRIEASAGLRLGEMFELHGEAYYRRLEREVLVRLLGEPTSMVVATGGSIVNDRDNWMLLRERSRTVWLRARAEDHWNRVIQQGDARPMAQNPHAFAELRALMTAREPLYSDAHHVVDTSGKPLDEVVEQLIDAVGADLATAPLQAVGQA